MSNAAINKMSIEEKISTMEMLWEDLCQHSSIDSPDWHQDVLASREQKRSTAQEQPMDWNEAKEHILKTTK